MKIARLAKGIVALAGWLGLTTPGALAMNHFMADRIHVFNPGVCSRPTGPLWITLGSGQPAPGFINVNGPGFDQIGALVTGNMPAEPEATLAAQSSACSVIASFYHDGTPVGAWVVPPDKLLQLISILQING